MVPGIDKFMAEYVSEKALGEDGYLAAKGLIPLPKDQLAAVRASVSAQTVLTPEAGL